MQFTNKTKRYPFKFLNAYTREDKAIFFGRDDEIKALYELVFQTDLLVIYGASGTGKTSLIDCGLANCFETYDWLPIRVRRGQDLNGALEQALESNRGAVNGRTRLDDEPSPLTQRFHAIYLAHFKPIFLIFDQFEELYVIGSRNEQIKFAETIRAILQIEQPIKILISIREEYLGYLYEFEQMVPELLRKKLRVEAMNLEKVTTVLRGIKELPDSLVQIPAAEVTVLAEAVFKKVRGKQKSLTIQLPYLQVFLDKFYVAVSQDENRKSEVTLKLADLDKLGELGDILRDFLDEQVRKIAVELRYSKDLVWKILSAFVTLEGTKQPNSSVGLSSALSKSEALDAANLLNELVNRRILRRTEHEEVHEVMHDSLAKQIHAQRSEEQLAILKVERLIKSQMSLKAEDRGFLSETQLRSIEPHLEKCALSKEEKEWIEDSRAAIKKASDIAIENVEREKRLRKEAETQRESAKKTSYKAIGVALVALTAMFVAWWSYQEAKQQKQEVEKQQKQAIENFKQFLKTDIKRLDTEIETAQLNLKDYQRTEAMNLIKFESSKLDSLKKKQTQIEQQLESLELKK